MSVIELNQNYKIIYDDKGFKPVVKRGKIVSIEGNLIRLDSGEILNTVYILRMERVDPGGL